MYYLFYWTVTVISFFIHLPDSSLIDNFKMSWRSSGKSNFELIRNLKENGIIKTPRIFKTMLKVDRKDFLDISLDSNSSPYDDCPQSIGCSATISAPHMHAFALEYLNQNLKKGNKVLDVGCGSGYLTTCFAYLVDLLDEVNPDINSASPCSVENVNVLDSEVIGFVKKSESKVIGIDHKKELIDISTLNIRKSHEKLLFHHNFHLFTANGYEDLQLNDKFDVIHVGAAADEVPIELLKQLNHNGLMLLPIFLTARNIQILKEYNDCTLSSVSLNVDTEDKKTLDDILRCDEEFTLPKIISNNQNSGGRVTSYSWMSYQKLLLIKKNIYGIVFYQPLFEVSFVPLVKQ